MLLHNCRVREMSGILQKYPIAFAVKIAKKTVPAQSANRKAGKHVAIDEQLVTQASQLGLFRDNVRALRTSSMEPIHARFSLLLSQQLNCLHMQSVGLEAAPR